MRVPADDKETIAHISQFMKSRLQARKAGISKFQYGCITLLPEMCHIAPRWYGVYVLPVKAVGCRGRLARNSDTLTTASNIAMLLFVMNCCRDSYHCRKWAEGVTRLWAPPVTQQQPNSHIHYHCFRPPVHRYKFLHEEFLHNGNKDFNAAAMAGFDAKQPVCDTATSYLSPFTKALVIEHNLSACLMFEEFFSASEVQYPNVPFRLLHPSLLLVFIY